MLLKRKWFCRGMIKDMEMPVLFTTIVDLSNFFIYNFPNIDWYPVWYLGNPYRFLIGPIVPIVMGLFKLFSIPETFAYILLIILSIILGGCGLFTYFRSNGFSKKISFYSSLSFVLFPLMYISLPYQNGLKYIIVGLLPLLFLNYQSFLKFPTKNKGFMVTIVITLLLLINNSSIFSIFIALIALVISDNTKNKSKGILQLILYILLAYSISLIWYTPEYLWITLSNPSIGGISIVKLIGNILSGLFMLLPTSLALIVTKWRYKKLSGAKLFSFVFFISFILLTLIRFVMDPDFIMDWSGFFPEIQLGLAMIIASFSNEIICKKRYLILIILSILGYSWIFINVTNSPLRKINKYENKIEQILVQNIKPFERVFLSGAPVFWLNNKDNILQVRGGNDLGSKNSWWAHGAYQLREGQDALLAANWLKIFGASYILIHSKNSQDYFKDFRNIDRFKDSRYFKLQYSHNGDFLYKVNNSTVARIADARILNVVSPQNGADGDVLSAYISRLKRGVSYSYINPNQILLNAQISEEEVISLAITYDRRWVVGIGDGILRSDALNNMIIVPQKYGKQEILLTYKRSIFDWIIPVISALLTIFMIHRTDMIFILLRTFTKRFSLDSSDDY